MSNLYTKKTLSEKAYINRTVLAGHGVIATILFLAYLLECAKGSRTLGYTAFFSVLALAPAAAELLVYRRDPESRVLKHIVGISYSVLYLFAVFTTHSVLTFTYAFPMFVLVTLFSDVLYCTIICVGGLLGNLVYVIYYALAVGYAAEEIPDVEIRMACMLLTGAFMILATVANKKVNDYKLSDINEQKDKADSMLHEILATSDSMNGEIVQVVEQMQKLGDSVSRIQDSMGEVSQGSTETADSIQVQLMQTEAIQNHILDVKGTSQKIENAMADNAAKVSMGKEQMQKLADQVEKSMNANEQVIRQMQELSEFTNQMNIIIETITSIAESTGLLALNASIEAARAGEAGKGFAVVAGEISTLANQTQAATVNITELIENINSELEDVVNAVSVVTRSNQANADSTRKVTENFEGIARGTNDVQRQTVELMEVIKKLEAANADIVEKIQTISAITEEVSAHSGETYSACEENSHMVEEVSGLVKALSADAEKLKSLQ